jgi:hypothetical protein
MEAGRPGRANGQATSFDQARSHFRHLEAAFRRVQDAERHGRPGTAEREAFLAQMHAFRRHAQLFVAEAHELLERRRPVDGIGG